MAVSMDALLKIKASVEGEGAVQGLATKLNTVQTAATKASAGFSGLANSAGGLVGGLKTLIPLFSGAGLLMLAQNSIKAGEEMYVLSQRTGVSVERLSQFKKAALVSGTSLESVTTGLLRLSKSMAAAASSTNLGQKTKAEIDKAVEAVRDGERKQTEEVKRQADLRVEKIQDESDARLRILRRRYRQEAQLLNDKYDDAQSKDQEALQRQEEQQAKYLDRQYALRRAQIQQDKELTDGQKQAALDALQEQQDLELQVLRDGYAKKEKEQTRASRDAQQKEQDALDDKQNKEEAIIRKSAETQKRIIRDSADASALAIKKAADVSERALKGTDGAADPLSEQLDELGLSGKGASDAFRELGVAIKNQDGTMRSSDAVLMDISDKLSKMSDPVKKASIAMKLFGRGGAELIPMLDMGSAKINSFGKMSSKFAEGAHQANESLVQLSFQVGKIAGQLATVLLPFLTSTSKALTVLVEGFNKLSGPLKQLIGFGVAIAIAWRPITDSLKAIGVIVRAVTPLIDGLGPLIAGWARAVVPAIAGITAAFEGVLAWLTGTLVPALAGIFSGPVGWTVLAVAAVVAMCVAFRKPIGQFLTWLGSAFANGVKALWNWGEPARAAIAGFFDWLGGMIQGALKIAYALIDTLFIQPWVNIWNGLLRQPVTAMLGWLGSQWAGLTKGFNDYVIRPITTAWNALVQLLPNAMKQAAAFVQNVWTGMVNAVKGVIHGMLQAVANSINVVGGLVNRLISGFNALPGADLPYVPMLQVPAFASGGVVTNPTMALVGEAGPEYIVPERKMAQASANYLSGARGAAVLNGSSSTAAPVINVTTGPVVEFDGKRYVSMDDLERAMRATAEGVIGRLRTPSARIALRGA